MQRTKLQRANMQQTNMQLKHPMWTGIMWTHLIRKPAEGNHAAGELQSTTTDSRYRDSCYGYSRCPVT